MAWKISIVLFGITSVCAGFYSGNWRNIQNTPWRLVKKIYDTYLWCVISIYIGWRMRGWLKGQSHILKTAIMVPRKRLSRAIAATFWPRGSNVKMQVYNPTKYLAYRKLRIPHCLLLYRWIGSRYTAPVIDNVENIQPEITYFDGTYSLTFTRDVRTGDSQDLDLDKDLYMMFPVGGGPINEASMTIGYHTMTPSLSGAPVNLYESLMGTMRTTTGNLLPRGCKI